ncbi:MAG: Tic20 family protein [Crinalium sp.]
MSWRGTVTPQDRVFASLPYLLPLIDVLPFGIFLFRQFPALVLLFMPLQPLIIINNFPFAGLIIFFVLYLAVVRNENISHFIRFNTLQAILLDIVLVLCSMLRGILLPGLGQNLLTETLMNVVFLGAIAACVYSVVQSLLGRYAEIPALSEAVYTQVR